MTFEEEDAAMEKTTAKSTVAQKAAIGLLSIRVSGLLARLGVQAQAIIVTHNTWVSFFILRPS